jgi:hypothetical protein
VTCSHAGEHGTVESLEFNWNREPAIIVDIGGRGPGLYEATGPKAVGQPAGLQVSARILGCASRSYPSARAAFANLQALTNKWQDATEPETTHAFLRAYLAQLARAGVCAA